MQNVLQGLRCCHQKKIVHCKISPDSVQLFTPEHDRFERWIITDFVNSRDFGDYVTISDFDLDLLPPEVALSHLENRQITAGPPMDMWAVGLVLFFLGSPRQDFFPCDLAQRLHFLAQGNYKRLWKGYKLLVQSLNRLLTEPDNRFSLEDLNFELVREHYEYVFFPRSSTM